MTGLTNEIPSLPVKPVGSCWRFPIGVELNCVQKPVRSGEKPRAQAHLFMIQPPHYFDSPDMKLPSKVEMTENTRFYFLIGSLILKHVKRQRCEGSRLNCLCYNAEGVEHVSISTCISARLIVSFFFHVSSPTAAAPEINESTVVQRRLDIRQRMLLGNVCVCV